MQTDVKPLLSNLSDLRKEISTLRSELNDLNKIKEGLYQDKDTVSKEIVSLIHSIKNNKRERDNYTKKVREHKKIS